MRWPTKVKCQRCETTWRCNPKSHREGEWYVNCPTCFRGYFFDEENGQWCSDRPLAILEHEER